MGIEKQGPDPNLWRRAWRDKILPALVNFKPDMIFVSAGFDAHKKDEINFGYLGVQERDYEWLTDQIVQIANRCCHGRVVSVLEGGYRIHGGIVSAFARSVAAHVRALAEPHGQRYDPADARFEREYERRRRAELEAKRRAQLEAQLAASGQVRPLRRAADPTTPPQRQSGSPCRRRGRCRRACGARATTSGRATSRSRRWTPLRLPGRMTVRLVARRSRHTPVPTPTSVSRAGRESKRRRRGPVDYVALNKKLEEEEEEQKRKAH